MRTSNSPHILAVLQHPGFLDYMHFFTSIRYGQAVFSFSLIEALILSKLNEVSFSYPQGRVMLVLTSN